MRVDYILSPPPTSPSSFPTIYPTLCPFSLKKQSVTNKNNNNRYTKTKQSWGPTSVSWPTTSEACTGAQLID